MRFLKPEEEGLLEAFVAEHPHGSIEQTWAWGVLQSSIPGRSAFYVLGAFDGGALVASMLLIQQSMGFKKHWLWCPRGPLLSEGAWPVLKEAVDAFARENGAVFLRLEPGAPMDQDFAPAGQPVHETYMPTDTLILDLSHSEATLLKHMKQKGRYNIKQAEKQGVSIHRSNGDDLDDFYEVLEETAKRDGFHVHDKSMYRHFFELLEERSILYTAYLDHELLGGMLVTHFGDTATYYFGASSNKHRKSMAPYALQWHAIQEAKAAGYKCYDFLGIAPEDMPKHSLAGVTQFKTRFGGKRLTYHGPQVFVYRHLWWWLRNAAKYVRRRLA